MDYRDDCPEILKGFLTYHETIKGHSKATVDEYYLDMRNFFRFLKIERNVVPRNMDFDEIAIKDVDLDFVKNVTLSEFYDFLSFLSRDKVLNERSRSKEYGLKASSRARKVSTIRSFYKYLTNKAKLIDVNPLQDIDSPKVPKTLPRYLTLDEAQQLLQSVDGKNKERDYCILCIFLNCGLRISEIVGLNLQDIREDQIRVFGKGSKERIVYINSAVANALNDYLQVRKNIAAIDRNALFLSNRRERISRETIHAMVKKYLKKAGLDADKYSAHKLRHTYGTYLIRSGADLFTVQKLLGHSSITTTGIYANMDLTDQIRAVAKLNFTLQDNEIPSASLSED